MAKKHCGCAYLRVSIDRHKRKKSIKQQWREIKADAKREGIRLLKAPDGNDIALHYSDVGSASVHARQARDDFDRLLADLESGAFVTTGANLLYLWELSRGGRTVEEWLPLLNHCAKQKVLIRIKLDQRTYDPRIPGDRRTLIEKAAAAEEEVALTSERVQRDSAWLAKKGRPHGKIPYGYMRIYGKRTGRLKKQVPDPVEAPVVRELYARIEAADSLETIAKDFEDRGIRSRKGAIFRAANLGAMARNETYVGRRVHDTGRIQGRTHLASEDRKVYKGKWEGLVSREQWALVNAILLNPERLTHSGGGMSHPWTVALRCDPCVGKVSVSNKPKTVYFCQASGHVRVDKDPVDERIWQALVAYMSYDDVEEAVDGTTAEELTAVQAELAEERLEYKRLEKQVEEGGISSRLAGIAEARHLEAIARLEAQEAMLKTPSVLRGIFQRGPGADERLKACTPEQLRVIASLVMTPDFLGQPRIIQVGKGRGRSVPPADRLVWARKDDQGNIVLVS